MVTDDPLVALRELERGENVVLIVGDSDHSSGPVVTTPGRSDGGMGRLAVMIGDPSDPATVAAAQEMHDELFRNRR